MACMIMLPAGDWVACHVHATNVVYVRRTAMQQKIKGLIRRLCRSHSRHELREDASMTLIDFIPPRTVIECHLLLAPNM